jgi:hypothetical protein
MALPRWASRLTFITDCYIGRSTLRIVIFATTMRWNSPNFRLAGLVTITYLFPNTFRVQEEREQA